MKPKKQAQFAIMCKLVLVSDLLGDEGMCCCHRKEIEIIPSIPLFSHIPHSSL